MRWIIFAFLIGCILLGVYAPKCIQGSCADRVTVDVLIIIAAGLTFFVVAHESAKLIPSNKLTWMRGRLSNHLDLVQSFYRTANYLRVPEAEESANPFENPERVRNFEIQRSRTDAWHRSFGEKLSAAVAASDYDQRRYANLEECIALDRPSQINERSLLQAMDSLIRTTQVYEQLRKEVSGLEEEVKRNPIEEISVFLAPFSAAIAIGLSLFKALNF